MHMANYKLTDIQNEFIEYCTDIIMTQPKSDKIPVICSPCGIGKTTALKQLINTFLKTNESPGAIVVTDTIGGLEDIAKDYRNNVSLLTSDNVSTEMSAQRSKKIFLM